MVKSLALGRAIGWFHLRIQRLLDTQHRALELFADTIGSTTTLRGDFGPRKLLIAQTDELQFFWCQKIADFLQQLARGDLLTRRLFSPSNVDAIEIPFCPPLIAALGPFAADTADQFVAGHFQQHTQHVGGCFQRPFFQHLGLQQAEHHRVTDICGLHDSSQAGVEQPDSHGSPHRRFVTPHEFCHGVLIPRTNTGDKFGK